jgi:Ca2+/Na+ antiporter
MANPLLQHPILKHMPYQELRNPTPEGIRSYVAKRKKMFQRLSILFVAIALFYPSGMILARGHINLDEMIFALLAAMMVVLCYLEFKKAKISEDEIVKVIDQLNSFKQSAA